MRERGSPIQTIKKRKSSVTIALDSERIIGSLEGSGEGPAVVILAGIHGNEPSGVQALQNVFNMLGAVPENIRGRIIGIRANIGALRSKVRYIDEDMNRIWFPGIIEQIRNTPLEQLASSERKEIKEVLKLLDGVIAETDREKIILADLHSFSAEGCMFAITAPKEQHTKLLSNMHIPMIFGIENTLRGTALRYYQDEGHLTFALEGGQHRNKLTVYNITAAIMVLLKEAGSIDAGAIDRMEEFYRHLEEHTRYVPAEVELVYQHIIEEGDNFSMREGFKNFQTVKKGEWLASDREGKIYAQCDGYLVMPLYQDQGNDGFFIVRKRA